MGSTWSQAVAAAGALTLGCVAVADSAVGAAGQPAADAVQCPTFDRRGPAPDPDLYCIDLVHAPTSPASPVASSLPAPPTPFGTAVTVDGHHRFELTLEVDGLPDPTALGAYTGFVAWATTPRLRPVLNLGPVSNGRTAIGGSTWTSSWCSSPLNPRRIPPTGRVASCYGASRPACVWSRRTYWP